MTLAHPRTRSLAVVLAVLASLGIPTLAFSAEADELDGSVTWGVRPAPSADHGAERANYYYEVEPGDVIEDALIVSNYNEGDIDLLVYAADAFTTTDGALDLLTRGEQSIGVGTWTASARSALTVPAGGSSEVPFTVTVPANATPGDHAGGIVTSLVGTQSAQGITVDRRLGSRIHIRIAGELAPAIAIEDLGLSYHGTLNPFGAGSAQAGFSLVNTGNVRLSGEQTVVVSGPFGIGSWSQTISVAELLPGDRKTFDVRLDGVLPLLWLGAEVSLVPQMEGGQTGIAVQTVAESAGTVAIPWSLLVLLAAIALLAFLLIRGRRRRKAAEDKRVADAVAAALESAAAEEAAAPERSPSSAPRAAETAVH